MTKPALALPDSPEQECEGLIRLIVESFRDAPNPSVEIAVEEIMRTLDDYAKLVRLLSGSSRGEE